MPKLLVTVSEPQDLWMRREAQRLGIPVSELMRRMIDARRTPEPLPEEKSSDDMEEPIYETFVRGKGLYDGCKTLVEMQAAHDDAKAYLGGLIRGGAALEAEVEDDHACVITDDLKAAKKLKMERREG